MAVDVADWSKQTVTPQVLLGALTAGPGAVVVSNGVPVPSGTQAYGVWVANGIPVGGSSIVGVQSGLTYMKNFDPVLLWAQTLVGVDTSVNLKIDNFTGSQSITSYFAASTVPMTLNSQGFTDAFLSATFDIALAASAALTLISNSGLAYSTLHALNLQVINSAQADIVLEESGANVIDRFPTDFQYAVSHDLGLYTTQRGFVIRLRNLALIAAGRTVGSLVYN